MKTQAEESRQTTTLKVKETWTSMGEAARKLWLDNCYDSVGIK